jgi:hypothetical protein
MYSNETERTAVGNAFEFAKIENKTREILTSFMLENERQADKNNADVQNLRTTAQHRADMFAIQKSAEVAKNQSDNQMTSSIVSSVGQTAAAMYTGGGSAAMGGMMGAF